MDYPGVGTGIWIRKGDKVLLGLRKGTYLPGTWCIPGGKLEMYEEWEDCARRETMEECGVRVQNVRLAAVLNDPNREKGTHYITLSFVADWESGEPTAAEPEKFETWSWFGFDNLPEPLFPATRNFIEKGYNPFTF